MLRRNPADFGFLRDDDVTNLKFIMADVCIRFGRSANNLMFILAYTFVMI